MTNCTRSTMNWHNFPKDFLWIESNSELRARLIGSIIIGDRGSACWAIFCTWHSAIELAMFDSISISLQPHQEYPLLSAPTLQGIFTCREKKLWKKKTITQIFSHCSKRNRVVGTGGGRVEVRQGVGVVGFENPICTQISSEIAKQSVCVGVHTLQYCII